MKNGIRRRDFFKAMAAGGGAAAALAGCSDRPEKLIPLLLPPDNIEYVPGNPIDYATTCQECPASCGVVIRTREGRAVKAEGNPDHPLNKGTLCIRGQASVQTLYHPNRIASAMERSGDGWKAMDWDAAEKAVAAKLKAAGGQMVLITNNRPGTRQKLVSQWVKALGGTKLVLDPLGHHHCMEANKLSFGKSEMALYQIDKADLLINFGADFLETWQNPVRNNRQFADMHGYDDKAKTKGKYIHVGPNLTLTGSNADKWISVQPGAEALVALALAAQVAKKNGSGLASALSGYTLEKASAASGASVESLAAVAAEIAKAKRPLALAGGPSNAYENATALQVAVNALNAAAGAVGKTMVFGAGQQLDNSDPFSEFLALTKKMEAGKVKVLVIDNTNPVYHLPTHSGFQAALAKVDTVISLSTAWDETTRKAHFVLPSLSTYESWGDANPQKGVYSLIQPVMHPLYPVKASEDTLISLGKKLGLAGFTSGGNFKARLQDSWKSIQSSVGESGSFDAFWRKSLMKGGVFNASNASGGAQFNTAALKLNFNPPAFQGDANGLVLIPTASLRHRDGSSTANPWLQEIPDPISQVVWDSWADIHPSTGKKLGLNHGEQIRLKGPMGEIVTNAFFQYGVHPGAIAIPMGQGHQATGYRGVDGYGVNVLDMLPAVTDKNSGCLAMTTVKVSVAPTGKPSFMVQVDGSPRQGERGLIQTISLEDAQKGEAPHHGHALKERPNDFYRESRPQKPGYHDPYRWGMVVDTDRCTGCSACVAACYAENNLNVVGKERMYYGREMAWIRLERFIEGEGDDTRTLVQPAMCQQCGNAGCEPVCPVFATYHNPDGLNAQVYNRCVGTRYCSNNCAYKQRRFNWFQYEAEAPLHLQYNPDVSVRSRGVMEKCTFCVQRIHRARFAANDLGRNIADGEVTPACAQTCPTQAITFGNLADPKSAVSKKAMRHVEGGKRTRQYEMLEELKLLPAVTYLRKVTHN